MHENGFIFCCSAGTVEFTEHRHEIPEHPQSFFKDCMSCIVVGSHGKSPSKSACIPLTFGSSGCCASDNEDTEGLFKQGIHTWAIGESVIIKKTNQDSDSIIGGTSLSTAVVAAATTFFLPKLISIYRMFGDKLIYSKKLKNLLHTSSDSFTCPNHCRQRNLIFNAEKIMDMLKYKRIVAEEGKEVEDGQEGEEGQEPSSN